jgi:AcrR family transcriptional regulator
MPAYLEIEDQFAAPGRTPKGQRALRGIFRAVRDIVAEKGVREASLDRIADHAGLTQAAVRHYFPTRDELLTSYFVTATGWFQARMHAMLAADIASPRDQLERCIEWHLEYMEDVDTVFWLEASAYWLRHKSTRHLRDDWYQWLAAQYSALIGRMHAELNPKERERKAYAILTLLLGAWVTHGRGSAVGRATSKERRQLLIDVAMDIASH